MSTDIEDRLNDEARIRESAGHPAGTRLAHEAALFREASSLVHDLREQVADLRGQMHFCPTCGEACKDCLCTEQREDSLRAERDALRNVVLNYLDDHARLVTNEALRERKRLLLPDELVPCACDICGYAERALSSPERSLSTAAHKSSSSTAAKGGETDG